MYNNKISEENENLLSASDDASINGHWRVDLSSWKIKKATRSWAIGPQSWVDERTVRVHFLISYLNEISFEEQNV